MKKSVKIFLIILSILIVVILVDTIQAKVLNNIPLIKIRYNLDGGNVDFVDKGIFVYTYVFTDEERKTVFRWEKYSPPLEESKDLEVNNNENVAKQENNTQSTKTYYLHKSDLETPSQDKCSKAKELFFSGINESEKTEMQKEILYIHSDLERLLVDKVSLLKDPDSPYWPLFTEKGVHKEPGHPETEIQSDGGFSNVLERVQKIIEKLKNDQIKDDLQKSCKLIQEGIDKHDISKLFEAHEIIHDYDYWVANSPISLNFQPVDWGGVNVYFGKVSIME